MPIMCLLRIPGYVDIFGVFLFCFGLFLPRHLLTGGGFPMKSPGLLHWCPDYRLFRCSTSSSPGPASYLHRGYRGPVSMSLGAGCVLPHSDLPWFLFFVIFVVIVVCWLLGVYCCVRVIVLILVLCDTRRYCCVRARPAVTFILLLFVIFGLHIPLLLING